MDLNVDDAIVVTIAEARRRLGIGTTKLYELIGAGQLDARKLGTKTVITAGSLRTFAAELPKAGIGRRGKAA